MASIAVIVVIFGLLGMLLPARSGSGRRAKCVNNLRQIGLGFRIFATDNEGKFPMEVPSREGGSLEVVGRGTAYPHFAALSNELSVPMLLTCPEDRQRPCATNFASIRDMNVSYFLVLDATTTAPGVLVGDRNLAVAGRAVNSGSLLVSSNATVGWTREMHTGRCNVVLADGSVLAGNSDLGKLLRATGRLTNRLAVP